MDRELRVVIVEDMPVEVELASRQLKRAGLPCHFTRVETEEDLRDALRSEHPDLILSDFSLPQFDGISALKVSRAEAPDTPFIFVSGTIGEERAIEALKLGATDYILKSNLARLAPAVRRALEEAQQRREKREAEQRLRDLVRIHSMLSSINSVVLRSRDRQELLEESARIAAEQGGYSLACVFLVDAGKASLRPFISKTPQGTTTDTSSITLSADTVSGRSITARAIRTGEPVVCNNLMDETQAMHPNDRGLINVFGSVVSLPLIVDATAVATLNLYSTQSGAVTDDELELLRQVAGNISFALQYLHKEDKVQFLAYFDALTGLAQRSLFTERLARLLTCTPGNVVTAMTVMTFDIERLSALNDRYGRHVSDKVLQLVAEQLKGIIHDTNCLAHFGAGRFGVVFSEAENCDGEQLRHKISQHIERSYAVEGQDIRISVRSGIAQFPEDGDTAELVLQHAETALTVAKQSSDKCVRYERNMNAGALQRLTLEHKLRQALDEHQYVLHYQPKIEAGTGRVVGVEALLRWQDPELGLVGPGMFVEVLEESGLIVDVGKWAIECAIADATRWHQQGAGLIPVAVNVSNVQLRRKDFVDTVLQILSTRASVPIDIEITESALMEDIDGSMQKLNRLKEAGIGIAIDDFGTGYSSLSRLAKLEVDALKIDRSFIVGLSSDPANMTLVSTIISLARSFDLIAVAEGVETVEQMKLLRLLKCHQVQGYLIARPMPADALSRLLIENRGIITPAAA